MEAVVQHLKLAQQPNSDSGLVMLKQQYIEAIQSTNTDLTKNLMSMECIAKDNKQEMHQHDRSCLHGQCQYPNPATHVIPSPRSLLQSCRTALWHLRPTAAAPTAHPQLHSWLI